MTCPVCHGLGYYVIDANPRLRKNPGRDAPSELRLPCVQCNGTGVVAA